MTCYWDGLLRSLDQEDLTLLNSNKNINNINFILKIMTKFGIFLIYGII